MSEAFSILCLSPQDWDVDLPTNRQQIMRRAARRGHRVLFVETGNFAGRNPSTRHLRARDVAPGISVRKALNVLPWGKKYALPNRVNGALTARVLRREARRLPQPVVLWIYDPCSSPLAGACGEAFAVYDCVDDYVEQNGSDARRRAFVAAGDERAAESSRLVFATTEPLFARQRRLNAHTHLVPNAADHAHFATAIDPALADPQVAALPRPVIGFAGNLTSAKVDFGLLESVARTHPEWTVALIGPARHDAEPALARLAELENVHLLGEKAYADLPRFVAGFDVALIPYAANEYTRSCFPLKLYEYLAAGKPVIASGLPELRGMEPDVVLAEDGSAFAGAIEDALLRTSPEDAHRRSELVAGNTWEARTTTLLELIDTELSA